uniref:Secreted protein n=1 Tax=Zea mays TaxID=4577 RepID=A0A804NVM1_MAIZE
MLTGAASLVVCCASLAAVADVASRVRGYYDAYAREYAEHPAAPAVPRLAVQSAPPCAGLHQSLACTARVRGARSSALQLQGHRFVGLFGLPPSVPIANCAEGRHLVLAT